MVPATVRRHLLSPTSIPQLIGRNVQMGLGPMRARAAIERVARSDGPIVIGPWSSEVGFELLYWIPFLNQVWEQHGISRERAVAISRGGAAPWYSHLAGAYVELLDYASQREVSEWRAERVACSGTQKQMQVDEFDRLVLKRAASALPADATLLHPSTMYGLFRPFWEPLSWERPRAVSSVTRHLRFRRFEAPEHQVSWLPERYVAVKAYFSDPFPDQPANRRFLIDLISRIAAQTDVVVLTSGTSIDDHEEYSVVQGDRVHLLDDAVEARTNLALQTAVIAGADALVTTYGGFAYLGPLLEVPTVAFYSEDNHKLWHLDIARRMTTQLSESGVRQSLTVLDVEDFTTLGPVVGSAATPWAPATHGS